MEEWKISKSEFTKAINWYLRTLENSNISIESININNAILRSFYYSINDHLEELKKNKII
jgi:hypothetical protein